MSANFGQKFLPFLLVSLDTRLVSRRLCREAALLDDLALAVNLSCLEDVTKGLAAFTYSDLRHVNHPPKNSPREISGAFSLYNFICIRNS